VTVLPCGWRETALGLALDRSCRRAGLPHPVRPPAPRDARQTARQGPSAGLELRGKRLLCLNLRGELRGQILRPGRDRGRLHGGRDETELRRLQRELRGDGDSRDLKRRGAERQRDADGGNRASREQENGDEPGWFQDQFSSVTLRAGLPKSAREAYAVSSGRSGRSRELWQ